MRLFVGAIFKSSTPYCSKQSTHFFWMWLMPEITRSKFTVATSSFFSHG